MRLVSALSFLFAIIAAGCGAGEHRAETTVETHTTAADDENADTQDMDAEAGDD
jgi:hypothetical protein